MSKAEEVIKAITELCNQGKRVSFEEDFGGFTLTVFVDECHTHVGIPGPDGSLEQLIDNLHDQFVNKRGLSWYNPNAE